MSTEEPRDLSREGGQLQFFQALTHRSYKTIPSPGIHQTGAQLSLPHASPITVAAGRPGGLPAASSLCLQSSHCYPDPCFLLLLTHFSIVLRIRRFLFPHLSFPRFICVLCCLCVLPANAWPGRRVSLSILSQSCCYLQLGLLLKWTGLHMSNQITPCHNTEET